jgi:hypothetical protein
LPEVPANGDKNGYTRSSSFFESRNPELVVSAISPTIQMRYRTKADALAAKVESEEKGKIVWPEVFKKPKSAKRVETQMGMRRSDSGFSRRHKCSRCNC